MVFLQIHKMPNKGSLSYLWNTFESAIRPIKLAKSIYEISLNRNRVGLIGPRLKAEWTYRIYIVRVCVYTCACVCVCGPDHLGIRS